MAARCSELGCSLLGPCGINRRGGGGKNLCEIWPKERAELCGEGD